MSDNSSIWIRGLRGALQSAFFFGVAGGVMAFYLNRPALTVPLCVGCLVAGAVSGFLGMVIANGILGSGVGMLLGLLVGSALGDPQGFTKLRLAARGQTGKEFALAGPTLQGERFDIKDYRGKVVLVDFWATWCPPCRAALPGIKNGYERFHDQGFEVVGVSLDEDKQELASFIKGHGMPWPQIIFDDPSQRAWSNPLAVANGVRSIPTTILVDREGKVSDLSGEQGALAASVERLLGLTTSNEIRLIAAASVGALAGLLLGAYMERSQRPRATATATPTAT